MKWDQLVLVSHTEKEEVIGLALFTYYTFLGNQIFFDKKCKLKGFLGHLNMSSLSLLKQNDLILCL